MSHYLPILHKDFFFFYSAARKIPLSPMTSNIFFIIFKLLISDNIKPWWKIYGIDEILINIWHNKEHCVFPSLKFLSVVTKWEGSLIFNLIHYWSFICTSWKTLVMFLNHNIFCTTLSAIFSTQKFRKIKNKKSNLWLNKQPKCLMIQPRSLLLL